MTRSRWLAALTLSVMAMTSRAHAQDASKEQAKHLSGGNEGKTPIGWKSRADAATDEHGKGDTLSFVQMTPGYHVTTGRGVILWSPDSSASGTFTVKSTIFLFPTNGRDQEGYGVFVGGEGLDGAKQRYTYFLLRNDGKFLIKQRQGTHLTVLKDWTALPAIKLQKGKDAMQNDLQIAVGVGAVTFSVNGAEAASLPRNVVAPDGIFGLRLSHAINAHVASVTRGK